MVPGEQATGAFLAEQSGSLKDADDLVPDQLPGGGGVDVRHGHSLTGRGPVAPGGEGVNVSMSAPLIPERLNLP